MSAKLPALGSPPRVAPRLAAIERDSAERGALVRGLLDVSERGLARMFRPSDHLFAHTLRRDARGNTALQGISPRYGAIALLGARHLDAPAQRAIFAGEDCQEFCARSIQGALESANLGDVSLTAWAAAELSLSSAARVFAHGQALASSQQKPFTVEMAWLLSAACALGEIDAAARLRDELLRAFPAKAGVFPRWLGAGADSRLRGHVSCFADQVYPIQALSRLAHRSGDELALAAATRCADQICHLQGDGGQWWWHYDTRTGAVIEGYPVYSVHQDAMGPMALLDLAEAGGPLHADAIARSLDWMRSAAEVDRTLVDKAESVIWRKVHRADPKKLVRGVRALATALHPGLRLGPLDRVFRPDVIETESRPYHLAWVLDTWLGRL